MAKKFVVSEIAEAQKSKGIMIAGSKALIMGFAFKEKLSRLQKFKKFWICIMN